MKDDLRRKWAEQSNLCPCCNRRGKRSARQAARRALKQDLRRIKVQEEA